MTKIMLIGLLHSGIQILSVNGASIPTHTRYMTYIEVTLLLRVPKNDFYHRKVGVQRCPFPGLTTL